MAKSEELDPALVKRGEQNLGWSSYSRHLRIADRETLALVPFVENPIQKRIGAHIEEKTLAGEPVRGIVLKSRRMGVSTEIQMRFAHRAFTSRRWACMTGCHEAKSSSALHAMVENAYKALPAGLQREKQKVDMGRTLEFVEGAKLETFTAGTGEGAGRGQGALGLHASEVAFWENGEAVLLALRQLIPDAPGTMIWLESTAHGLRNVFRSEWVKAVEGRSGYTPFFFAWFEFPDYTLDRKHLTPDRREVCKVDDAGELDPVFWQDYPEGAEDEEDVLRGVGVSEDQLCWRRFALATQCDSSLDFFHQEFPSTPEEAFLSSGRPFIPPALQVRLAKMVVSPRGIGDIDGLPLPGGRVDFAARRFGPLHIWEPPDGNLHVIGADTAGGITEEEQQARERNEADSCSYTIVNLTNGRTVAEFSKVTDADIFASDLARAGWAYKDRDHLPAEIAVESNGMGLLTLSKLRDEWRYPRIYHREGLAHEHRGQRAHTIGWLTSLANRGAMLAQFKAIVRDHPEFLPSRRLLDQIRTFVWMTDKRVEHEVGSHDDIVFSTAIAYQLFLMRSYFATEAPPAGPPPDPESVSALEALLVRPEAPKRRLRETVLARQMPRR